MNAFIFLHKGKLFLLADFELIHHTRNIIYFNPKLYSIDEFPLRVLHDSFQFTIGEILQMWQGIPPVSFQ